MRSIKILPLVQSRNLFEGQTISNVNKSKIVRRHQLLETYEVYYTCLYFLLRPVCWCWKHGTSSNSTIYIYISLSKSYPYFNRFCVSLISFLFFEKGVSIKNSSKVNSSVNLWGPNHGPYCAGKAPEWDRLAARSRVEVESRSCETWPRDMGNILSCTNRATTLCTMNVY